MATFPFPDAILKICFLKWKLGQLFKIKNDVMNYIPMPPSPFPIPMM